MNEADLELALKKQRLVLRSAALRVRMGREAGNLRPAFGRVDQIREAVAWVREHLSVVAAAATVVAVVRPRAVFRWGRRGLMAWRAWRALASRLPS